MSNPTVDPDSPQDGVGAASGPQPSQRERPDDVGFWRHKSVDELAAEQGVQPIEDFQAFLDEIGGVWPEEESVEEFIAWLAKTRRGQ